MFLFLGGNQMSQKSDEYLIDTVGTFTHLAHLQNKTKTNKQNYKRQKIKAS